MRLLETAEYFDPQQYNQVFEAEWVQLRASVDAGISAHDFMEGLLNDNMFP